MYPFLPRWYDSLSSEPQQQQQFKMPSFNMPSFDMPQDEGYDPQLQSVVDKFQRLKSMDPNQRMYAQPQERDLTPQERDIMHGALGLPSERIQGEIRQIMGDQDRAWGKQIYDDGLSKGTGMGGNINVSIGQKYMQGNGPDRNQGMLRLPEGDQLSNILSRYGTQMSPELRKFAGNRDRLWNDLGMGKAGLPAQFSPLPELPGFHEATGTQGAWKGGPTFSPFGGKGGQEGVSRFTWGEPKATSTSVSGQILPRGSSDLSAPMQGQYDKRGFADTPPTSIPSWQQQYYPKGPYGNLKRTGIDPSYVPVMSDMAPDLPGSSWRGAQYPGQSGLDTNPQTGKKFADEGILNPIIKIAPMPGVYEKHDVRGRVIEQFPKVGPIDFGTQWDIPKFAPGTESIGPKSQRFPNFFDGLAMFGWNGGR